VRGAPIRKRAALCLQVVVLSEGHQLYSGDPKQAVPWFSGTLNYTFNPEKDGAVSDWLMDMVRILPAPLLSTL
jgi:hypothetical protein